MQANGPTTPSEQRTSRPPQGDVHAGAAGRLRLPCHGSQYDTEGDRTAGPPVRALDRWAYKVADGRLRLIGAYSVDEVEGSGADATLGTCRLAQPGVHIDGLEQVLYPFIPPLMPKSERASRSRPSSRIHSTGSRSGYRPRRRDRALPLPQGPRRTNWSHARLGHADRVPRSGHHRGHPRDVLQPDPDQAYESILFITNDLTWGWLVRGMHRWGASVFIILMFFHMARVFLFGAYKYPREVNWIVGSALLILGMFEGFTGYLLPWDQTVVLGVGRRHQHHGHRPVRRARSSPTVMKAEPRSTATRSASTRSTCSSYRARSRA